VQLLGLAEPVNATAVPTVPDDGADAADESEQVGAVALTTIEPVRVLTTPATDAVSVHWKVPAAA
jgi:hypothetical protein